MKVDWLIVGAGFTGATLAERIAYQCNEKVLIVEKRDLRLTIPFPAKRIVRNTACT